MIEIILIDRLKSAIKFLYKEDISENLIQIQKTRSEFDGDITVVVFPFLKLSRKSPEQTADEIGKYLIENIDVVESYNIIKGFLNIVIKQKFWLKFFEDNHNNESYGKHNSSSVSPVVIEYSSPNTNKPLHLGHIRNNLLGWSVSEIILNGGKEVKKVNLINDRGIHICKSMLAWMKWGEGSSPESTNLKGDKFVGEYYVLFDKKNKEQIAELVANGMDNDEAAKKTDLLNEAKDLLIRWENEDSEVRELWNKMNGWVYDGFDITYDRMGIDFHKVYHESETYILGKKLVNDGVINGVLFKKDDGSVWCNLTDEGLDEKLVLRADGTSVYMTQDLGTAQLRFDEFKPSEFIYVVGNEQNYHFDVLKLILKKLGKSWAEHIYHLSYGMVELPEGKMKSREGTVVDADDLMDEMYNTAKSTSEELGKFNDFSDQEAHELYSMLSLGALKYFILKVDPKKTMTFNPKESIDFNGNTGPFIQYTHARIKSILRKASENNIGSNSKLDYNTALETKETSLIKLLYEYPSVTIQASENMSPALVANYAYELAKEFNQFYHDISILKESDEGKRDFRISLSAFVARTLKSAMALLGIQVPERM
ncbi:MAG: arginine--tRNA ligase [Lentimicrobiaceae bacterium]|nr:arginine--tRNA ligase [Lentimicrobiaceae bacterium]MDG1901533.1 arginine--tRNA ligase [Bacteroidales bacterium]MDG2081408.1 arginine--tRNA ligase [Bacteroidales bacterium]